MLKTLFLKEWKDKVHLFLFGVAIQVLAVLASLGMSNKEGLQDLLHGALLVIYFPFIALLLGSSAFEREFKSDAWAYLFSRPIKKASIWAVKFVALFSLLGILWGIFLGIVEATVGIKVLTKGFELPLGAGAELNLLQLGFLVSLTLFTVSFSLSFFSERSLSVLFVSLCVGAGLTYGLIRVVFSGIAAFDLRLTDPRVAVLAYRWGPLLIGAAFGAASLWTFSRADFSQPRKKIAFFSKKAVLLVSSAAVVFVLWMIFLPGMREKRVWVVRATGTDAFVTTDRGFFKYDAARDKIVRLTKFHVVLLANSVRAEKIVLYSEFPVKRDRKWSWELGIMSTDGTGRKRLLGGDIGDSTGIFPTPRGQIISPDGRRMVFSTSWRLSDFTGDENPFWTINTDGSGLKNLPMNSALMRSFRDSLETDSLYARATFSLGLVAWPENSEMIIFRPWSFSGSDKIRRNLSKLFLYDLESGATRLLFEASRLSYEMAASPSQKRLAFIYRSTADDEFHLAVIDLDTLEIIDVHRGDIKEFWYHSELLYRLRWDAAGEKLAFLLQRKSPQTDRFEHALIVYSATERRVMSEKALDGADAGTTSFAWLSDGQSIVVNNRSDPGLSIFSHALEVEKKIAFPASAHNLTGANVVGDKILVIDTASDDLWRFDLKTEKWKRIY